jgi:hypothetical protein
MSILLAVVLSISQSPSTSAQPIGAQPDAAPSAKTPSVKAPAAPVARSGRELADAAHAAMRKWAKASDKEADAAARDLLGIYCELQQDTKLARSTRETLRTTVRARLDQLSTQISKRIASDKAATKPDAAKRDATVKSVAATGNPRPMAQVGAAVGGGSAGYGGQGGTQGAAADYGQALVDLIQNTISPKSWDVNGGNGTISYWQQQHAIVVRATGEVHEQISDALQQLDRASH